MTRPVVAVFGSSHTGIDTDQWIEAEQVGRDIANAGYDVVTGGYGGTMEAVSKGATLAGGFAFGVTAPSLFPGRAGANSYVTSEIVAESLADRISAMVRMSIGCIALPGSIGTATELLIAWNTNHIRRNGGLASFPSVAVGEGWSDFRTIMIQHMAALEDDVAWVETGSEATIWLLDQVNPPRPGDYT